MKPTDADTARYDPAIGDIIDCLFGACTVLKVWPDPWGPTYEVRDRACQVRYVRRHQIYRPVRRRRR